MREKILNYIERNSRMNCMIWRLCWMRRRRM